MSKPILKIIFGAFFLSCLPLSVYATVGGPQQIEVLGLDRKAQKIYLMRHFEDGRGRLPKLYYYQLNSTNPTKLIQVRSLYINPKTKLIDYDQDSRQFDIEIAKIQKRLISLQAIHNSNVRIQILTNKKGIAKAWYDPQKSIDKWSYQYRVKSFHLKSTLQKADTYEQGLNISKVYKVPHSNNVLVTVKYLGIPFETGYSIEDPVLLTK
ncbi:aminotransferase [Acinetobacter sp. 2JN-4]|uniref:aminotransferase n=1 Tax=Acinetobacter sp. 2JN-4 TaxID=2479844 RepID=UPI000EF9E725|nr:aminotransferase [Acinetobacter sp. 2JN-4]RLZ08986.1 aminotransferase [Acinetobacter sp. 2JN-4]